MAATTDISRSSSQQDPEPVPPRPEVTARALLCSDADISLRCKDDREVAAHSMMLRLSSTVWRDLLDNIKCSVIPADEDCAEDMELLLCLLYPVMPKPQLSLDNVAALAQLAFKYDVRRALGECDIYLQSLEYTTTQPTLTVPTPWDADMKHAVRWLQLGSNWNMPLVVDKSLEALNCVLRAAVRQPCGRQHHGPCTYRSGGQCTTPLSSAPVGGLQPFLCSVAFLSGLSHATLIKLVQAAATWSP